MLYALKNRINLTLAAAVTVVLNERNVKKKNTKKTRKIRFISLIFLFASVLYVFSTALYVIAMPPTMVEFSFST